MTDIDVLVLNNHADIRTSEDLLISVLPQFIAVVDGAFNAQVYHLARGGLVVWHDVNNPDTAGTFITLVVNSPLQAAIEQKQIVVDEETKIAVAPMIANGDIFALLVLEFEGEPVVKSLLEFAADLSVALHNRHLHRLLQQQMSAMALLNDAKTLTDIAAVIGKSMAESEQYIGMNVFEYDTNHQVNAVRFITSANRRDAYDVDLLMPFSPSTLQTIHEILLRDGDMLINDVSTEEVLSDGGREWLLEQNARSVYLIAMSIDGHLSAFISLIDTKRSLAPTEMEILLFKNVAHQAATVLEKQRLLEQTRQSAEQSVEQIQVMQLLNDLIAKINTEQSGQDETQVLQQMADVLLEATQVDHVGIVLNEEERAFVVGEAPSLDIIGVEVEVGAGSVSAVLSEQRRALVIADIVNDTILPKKSREVLKQVGTQSIILLPMFDLDNRLLGSVGLDYYTQQESISPAVVDTAQMIVSQVVVNLHKMRLLAQSQRQAKQLQHINEFGQKLRTYLSVEEVVTMALDASQDLLSLDYVAIMLYERESDSLRYVAELREGKAQVGFPGKLVDAKSNMIATQAWTKREMMYVDNLHADWEWKHPMEKQLQTVIAQPLTSAGVVLGIMEVGHHLPSAYNAIDISTFQQMSNQLAVALSNANAYAQSQTSAQNKSLVNEIITKIQQQSDVNDILEITVQELGQALGAKRGRIRLGTPESSGEQQV
jgi:GAF domain-containing protein